MTACMHVASRVVVLSLEDGCRQLAVGLKAI